MLKSLRITALIVSFAVTLALGVFWLRSYQRAEYVSAWHPDYFSISVSSSYGGLTLTKRHIENCLTIPQEPGWLTQQLQDKPIPPSPKKYFLGFRVHDQFNLVNVAVPYWFLFSLGLALTALLGWKLPRNYDLRTLFIVITLIAVLLGICIAVGVMLGRERTS